MYHVAEIQPSTITSEDRSVRHFTNPPAQSAISTPGNKTLSNIRQRTSPGKKIADDDIPEAHDEVCVVDVDDD